MFCCIMLFKLHSIIKLIALYMKNEYLFNLNNFLLQFPVNIITDKINKIRRLNDRFNIVQ